MMQNPVPLPAPRRPAFRTAVRFRAVGASSIGLLLLLSLGAAGLARAQTQTPTAITPIPLTLSAPKATTTNTYTQDFNSLANTGTSASVLPTGFGFVETGTAANATYTIGNGSSATGDTYSFGSTGSSDRALGTLRDGSVNSTIGAVFVNNTGSNLQSLTVSYTGEQWRTGGFSLARGLAQDRLDFQFNPNSGALTGTTGFTDYNNLDFNSPVALVASLPAGAVDGNAAGNRTAISYTITGLNIPNGQNFALRFVDYDVGGANDGLAIDDFQISGVVVVPEPWTALAGVLALGALVWTQRWRLWRRDVPKNR